MFQARMECNYLKKAFVLYAIGFLLILFYGSYQLFYWIGWTALCFGYLSFIRYRSKLIFPGKKYFFLIIIFLLSFILRASFVFHPLQFSHDMESHLIASRFWDEGKLPFSDEAAGNAYPPLAFIVWRLIYLFSETVAGTKFVYILVDSLIPLVIYYLANYFSGKWNPSILALLYALNPLSLIEVGWSGHFDVLPSIMVLLSLYFLLSSRIVLAGAFFSASVLLKWYSIFILPIIVIWLLRKRSLRELSFFTLSALAILLLVSIIFFMIFPAGKYLLVLKNFLLGGGNIHFCGRSISMSVYKIANFFRPGLFSGCPPVAYLFYLGVLLAYGMYYLRGKISGTIVKLVLAVFIVHLSTLFLSHLFMIFSGSGGLPLASRVYSLFFLSLGAIPVYAAIKLYRPSSNVPSLIEVSIFILLLVILAQPVFAPWYFLWLTPLILLLDDEKKMLYLMAALLFTQPVFYYGPPYYFTALSP